VTALYWIAKLLLRVIYKSFFALKVYGLENLPRGTAIIAANHQSFVDPTVLGASVPEEIAYLAREDVFSSAALRWFCVKVNSILIKRRAGDRSALKAVLARLAEGWKVVVFPEGTRSYDGQLQPPERGISLLAHRSRAPVVPAYISGTHDVLPRGGAMIHFNPVSVSFGPPLRFDNESLKQGGHNAYHAFSLQVMDAIARLKASHEPGTIHNPHRSPRSTDR
jgi:1-acyl-sn-glycerol-3-phosphate acyltransferase